MKVFVVGNGSEYSAILNKVKANIPVVHVTLPDNNSFEERSIVFDFGNLVSELFSGSIRLPNDAILFFNVPATTLAQLKHDGILLPENRLFGFNGLPKLIDASILEVSVLDHKYSAILKNLMSELKINYEWINDTVGMCSPRIISLIINEAFYTYQEGTAEKEDIDTAMKLGTNYPHGPFEWLQSIGVKNVFEVLNAVYRYTGEERYKPAPLLKKYYLLNCD